MAGGSFPPAPAFPVVRPRVTEADGAILKVLEEAQGIPLWGELTLSPDDDGWRVEWSGDTLFLALRPEVFGAQGRERLEGPLRALRRVAWSNTVLDELARSLEVYLEDLAWETFDPEVHPDGEQAAAAVQALLKDPSEEHVAAVEEVLHRGGVTPAIARVYYLARAPEDLPPPPSLSEPTRRLMERLGAMNPPGYDETFPALFFYRRDSWGLEAEIAELIDDFILEPSFQQFGPLLMAAHVTNEGEARELVRALRLFADLLASLLEDWGEDGELAFLQQLATPGTRPEGEDRTVLKIPFRELMRAERFWPLSQALIAPRLARVALTTILD